MSDAVERCAAVPVAARRTSGFAANIGGAQGGGEPIGAARWSDLWESFDTLRSQLAEREKEIERMRMFLRDEADHAAAEQRWSDEARLRAEMSR